MPRKDYLLRWVRRLPELGVNTVLIEYEDKFPYERHPFLRDASAFTPDELRAFLAAARDAGVRPVPLVQSLSHLEFALAHEELAHLREAPPIHTQICPRNDEAVELVRGLVAEVLAYHREDELFHLGGDETWSLGVCDACKAWVEDVGGTVAAWAEHQKKIMSVVRDAGKRPVYWDDIFWKRPASLHEADLPKDVVLHSWNYVVTADKVRASLGHEEYGNGGKPLARVDTYQDAGYDVLAGPCLDWGLFLPRHRHCLSNTAAWALKARASGMRGLINTGWSVFHVPLPAKWLYTAATGALMNGRREPLDAAWEREFIAREFGTDASGVAAALGTVSQQWEVPCEGYERPMNPIGYGYMEMVLHFPKGHADRCKRGAYPLDWDEVDFVAMHRRKMELLRAHPDVAAIRDKARDLAVAYEGAAATLRALARAATYHRDEAALLSLFADMKLLRARILYHQLTDDGDATQFGEALDRERPRLEERLAPFLESPSIARMVRIWWEPLRQTLREA